MSNNAIYRPKGSAQEYAEWACNFFVGCSNLCQYCFLKKGRGAKILGGDVPTLKKCFKDEQHAMEVFNNELYSNRPELQKHGLFFSFTTDPCLRETFNLTMRATKLCLQNNIPVKILTKVSVWVDIFLINVKFSDNDNFLPGWKSLIAFGFTLTGHDEIEPGASTNQERIEAMRKLHNAGFKTFASIEPIVDFESSFKMMQRSRQFCDLYKIGLMSGKKYELNQVNWFISVVLDQFNASKIYFKDSLLKAAGIDCKDLPANCVSRDYNMFDQ